MKIEKNITINFSEEEVKEIIADYLSKKGYEVTPDDVQLSVGSRTKNWGTSEYELIYFKGAYVECKEK